MLPSRGGDGSVSRPQFLNHYGDAQTRRGEDHTPTGEDWLEENECTGKVGRSVGPVKVPLMIPNAHSSGGGSIPTHCIVRIVTTSGRELYRHPSYSMPQWNRGAGVTGYPFGLWVKGKNHANFKTREKMERFIAKMEK